MSEPPALAALVVAPDAGRPVVLGGTVVTLRIDGSATGNAYAAMNIALAPGAGAALHRHHYEAESFAVLSGVITFQLAEQRTSVGAGGLVFIPRGVLHAFRNAGAEPATALIIATPGGLEHYFAELGALLTLGDTGTNLADAITALNERYGLEFLTD